MRNIVSILLVTAILSPILVKTGLIVWYQQNKTSITLELCVNKDNPELECHGKCHLKKQMEKVEWKLHKQTNEAPAVVDLSDQLQFYTGLSQHILTAEFNFTDLINRLDEHICKGYPSAPFEPPRMTV